MIRLAISEDHTVVRWALREALGKDDDLEVVGEAGTASETLEMIQRERPDVLILDISLPDRSGFDVLNEMRSIENVVRAILSEGGIKLGTPARAAFAGRVRELAGDDPLIRPLVTPLLAILAKWAG